MVPSTKSPSWVPQKCVSRHLELTSRVVHGTYLDGVRVFNVKYSLLPVYHVAPCQHPWYSDIRLAKAHGCILRAALLRTVQACARR
jgi:hypothetical protein